MADNLYNHISPNIRPPNSPNLYPLDYYVWSVVGKEFNEDLRNTKDSLKAIVVRIMSDTNKEQLISLCNPFRPRINAVIDASGGFIE